MKKLTGWLLIVFCSMSLLVFALSLISLISGGFIRDLETQVSTKEIFISLLGLVVMISLLVLGLISGLKRIKNDKAIEVVNYAKELNINLKGRVKFADYRNLILGLSYKKPIYGIILVIMLLLILTFIVNKETMMGQQGVGYIIFIPIAVFLLSPVFTIIRIKQLFKTNRIFNEELNYTLTNDAINIKGSTLDSTQKWSHFFQMRETKNFFMFYQGKMVATLLDKKMFSETDLHEFEEFTKSLNLRRV